jgi:hypothetical protein
MCHGRASKERHSLFRSVGCLEACRVPHLRRSTQSVPVFNGRACRREPFGTRHRGLNRPDSIMTPVPIQLLHAPGRDGVRSKLERGSGHGIRMGVCFGDPKDGSFLKLIGVKLQADW